MGESPTNCVSLLLAEKKSSLKVDFCILWEIQRGLTHLVVSLLGETLGGGALEPCCWLERPFLRGFLTPISKPLKPKLRSSTYKFRGRHDLGSVFQRAE